MGEQVTGVFGKKYDVADLVPDADIREIIAPVDQLQVFDTDPSFKYGWLDTRDPMTQNKLRKGHWEAVTLDLLGDVKVPSMTSDDDGFIHVRELILVRMPREKYERIERAITALSVRREVAVQQQYEGKVTDTSKYISPGETGDPRVSVTAEVKQELRKVKK